MVHLESVHGHLSIPFTHLFNIFLKEFLVLQAQLSLNTHRIIAYFPIICACHGVVPTIRPNTCSCSKLTKTGLSQEVLQVKARDVTCSIVNFLENNKGWKSRFFAVKIDDPLLIDNIWAKTDVNFKRLQLTSAQCLLEDQHRELRL